jgi:hypothetical protein
MRCVGVLTPARYDDERENLALGQFCMGTIGLE